MTSVSRNNCADVSSPRFKRPRFTLRDHIALLTVLTFSYTAVAATSSIGVAESPGKIRVDGSLVKGNATVFEGSVVETENSTTAVRLEKGVVVKLATDSRGKLFRDHLTLEKGSSEFSGGSYRMEVATLKVTPADSTSRAVVAMSGDRSIEVTALAGSFRVVTDGGVLLANVRPGAAFAFSPQATGASAPTTITGKVTKEGGVYFVTAQQTGVKYQVTGSGVTDSMVGKTVTVTGTPDPTAKPAGSAAAVIILSSASVARGAAAAGASTAGMAAGTKLIIAGVVVAAGSGVGVGVYQAQKDDTPASR